MSETTDLIKRLRAAKLSQTEISRRTGIPQPRLSRWESGEVPDAADDALKLAALVAELPFVPEHAPAPELTPIDKPKAERAVAAVEPQATQQDIDTAMRHTLAQRESDRILFGAAQPPASDRPSNQREH